MAWILLVMTLAGQQAAVRIRIWRALKALGAAAIRDGVYLLPARDGFLEALDEQKSEIAQSGGSAFVFTLPACNGDDERLLRALFERREDYATFIGAVAAFVVSVSGRGELEARRLLRQRRRDFEALAAIDFFPGDAQAEAKAALDEAEAAFTRTFSPEEPATVHTPIPQRDRHDFQQRIWVTREKLWIDRLASAWLIARFIDSTPTFRWLKHPADAPPMSVGFDFDGAPFTHVDQLISFEVLLRSFGLDTNPALARLGTLVRSLDVGGVKVAEGPGLEAMLTGARESYRSDDLLFAEVSKALDCLYIAFSAGVSESSNTSEVPTAWLNDDRPSSKSLSTS